MHLEVGKVIIIELGLGFVCEPVYQQKVGETAAPSAMSLGSVKKAN